MIETALLIAAGVSVLVLMIGSVAAFGYSLNTAQELNKPICEEQYREQLRRNYDQMHRFSDKKLHVRNLFQDL